MSTQAAPHEFVVFCDASSIRATPNIGLLIGELCKILNGVGIPSTYIQDRLGLIESASTPHEAFLCKELHDAKEHGYSHRLRDNYEYFAQGIDPHAAIEFGESSAYHEALWHHRDFVTDHIFKDPRFGQWPEVSKILQKDPSKVTDPYFNSIWTACVNTARLFNFLKDPENAGLISAEEQKAFGIGQLDPMKTYYWDDPQIMNPASPSMPLIEYLHGSRYGIGLRGIPGKLTRLGEAEHKKTLNLGEAAIRQQVHRMSEYRATADAQTVMTVSEDNGALFSFESMEHPNIVVKSSIRLTRLLRAVQTLVKTNPDLPQVDQSLLNETEKWINKEAQGINRLYRESPEMREQDRKFIARIAERVRETLPEREVPEVSFSSRHQREENAPALTQSHFSR